MQIIFVYRYLDLYTAGIKKKKVKDKHRMIFRLKFKYTVKILGKYLVNNNLLDTLVDQWKTFLRSTRTATTRICI